MALKVRTLICCIDRRTELITDMFKESGFDELLVIATQGLLTPVQPEKMRHKYEDALELVVRTHDAIPRMKFVRYNIYNFDEMMRALNSLVQQMTTWNSEPYISIACGSGEFCAAASIIAMMYNEVHLISNYTNDFIVPVRMEGHRRQLVGPYGVEGVMMTEGGITEIGKIEMPKPDLLLLRALRIYSKTDPGIRSGSNMIRIFKDEGIWYELRGEPIPRDYYSNKYLEINLEDPESFKKQMFKEKNFFVRDIMGAWKKEGWVASASRTLSGYEITDKGYRMMYIFLAETDDHPVHRIEPEDVISENALYKALYSGSDFLEKTGNTGKGKTN